jgi:predicted TIM-barrel enzyme
LAVVVRHVGDVRHATKASFNRVVTHVIASAEHQGLLDDAAARRMDQRLEAAFADLRGTMSAVYDETAPVEPNDDLPRVAD